MKKNLVILAIAAVGLAGCKGGFTKSDGGLLYKIVEHKSTTTIAEGDFVSIEGYVKNDGDSTLASTYDLGHPWALAVPKSQFKGDLVSALNVLGEGDSAIIKINADTMQKRAGQPKPPGFKGTYVVYQLRVTKVISKGKLSDQVFQGRIQDYIKSLGEKTKAQEPGKIKTYIESNKLAVTKTASGLNYVITKQGNGQKPAVGDTAVVNYVGKFVSGKVFDTNIKEEAQKAKMFVPGRPYEAARIPVGVKAVIPGWDEGLQLLSIGAKATFVVPSDLAYGASGGGQIIPPYTPLVFEVELVKIIHPNPNAPKPQLPAIPQGQPQAQVK
jgi:FKBP-type peptidyl-prolyl cis-trans isomerase FkpA